MSLLPWMLRVFTLVIVSFITTTANAGSSVWKITSADKTLYLGGTVHMLRQSDYPLPSQFNQAYAEADKLVFETDLAQLQNPGVQQRMQQAVRYADKGGLRQRVSPVLYQRIDKVWQQYGLPGDLLNGLRPSGVIITLTMLNLKQIGVDAQGIDDFFHSRAIRDGKPVGGMETADQQISFLGAMGEGDEERFMAMSLDELEQSGDFIDELIGAWRRGSLVDLDRLMVADMRRDFPEQYRTLLADRNEAWIPQIETMLKDQPVEFVLVGSGHLAGEDGLLRQLKQRGYRIELLH
ncbi:TraB/GumN family protein [Amphritea japonica]|uniref:Homoserine kinase n=1 Tax=Amphritea japonica ATCC BAA-1530 TaxID=1278309 RepID=A0A7R6PM78_9GAMM|nr:TraB/GumN family protein [Amphritea japonica]BBB26885.1 homoserine kinase [Amphritea japonica ATCC BAA-1530]